jgi:hypothetical protein
MDFDENDLLNSNSFISEPDLTNEVQSDFNNEFKNYYKNEQQISEKRKLKESLDRLSIRSVRLEEDTDDQSIMNTNRFGVTASLKSLQSGGNQQQNRKTKEILTYISIDSRDRDKLLYKKPSYFKIFLGKTFYNVKTIRLSSIEFPNTNAVINTSNHHIYWRNQEDIVNDTLNAITKTYPEYSVQLRTGSYVSTSLQSEIANKVSLVKRKDNLGSFHYFLVSLDIDTDVVTFTSLILTQLSNNSLQTSVNTGIIVVTAPDHGFVSGENIYLVGAQTLAGIQSSTINTKQKITVLNPNTFIFEVNVNASQTLTGGGNTLKTGKIAPFQLLFGEHSTTIAQNIGYPLENSSELINTYIKSITNLYQAIITTTTPHNLSKTTNFLGKTCIMYSSGVSPNIDGALIITDVVSSTSFLASINSKLVLESYNSGQVVFNSITYNIQSISNYNTGTILVTTHTIHNYTLSNIGTDITLLETKTTPNLDDTFKLLNVFDDKSFVIGGSLPSGGESINNDIGSSGKISRFKPLTTYTIHISNIITSSSTTTLLCHNHNLQLGDIIMLKNIKTSPPIANIPYTIYAIPSSNSVVINTAINTFNTDTILNETAYLSTGLFTVSFPSHSFNKIISIQNTSGIPSSGLGSLIKVQTQLPHNFSNNQLIRFNQTNSTPSIDNSYNITITSPDTFTIPYSYPIISSGTSGIIGFDQKFYIYNSINIGGISELNINSKEFMVRDIIDKDTFTFYNNGAFATSTEKGGGSNLYISSLLHGFNGQQTNTKNSVLNRSINLQGENYSFLCSPQLSTMMNTGKVNNVFARISLSESPGSMVFTFLSNPKNFDTVPLNSLEDLEFSIVNYDGTEYEFNDLDYSFTLEITEIQDVIDNFNLSSKRGVI